MPVDNRATTDELEAAQVGDTEALAALRADLEAETAARVALEARVEALEGP